MRKPVIGLLPLYIELYDTALPEIRATMEAFYTAIADALRQRDIAVVTTPVCRVQSEFAEAIRQIEVAGADALVTLHLAYSPSLESAEALAATALPIIVLDTTPTYGFGPDTDPAEIMGNHGIHGVQDMCNLLLRNGKAFQIEAGHWERSNVLDRVASWARAAALAAALRTARVGRIGDAFHGMGDFAVPADELRATLGVETVPADPAVLHALLPADDDPRVNAAMAADRERFALGAMSEDAHRQSVRAGLAVRRWITEQRLSAFTVNFLVCDRACGLPTVPFLEASKAMARGIGYAGEGDVLTAALVGALAAVFPQTTFTEMFCPDWEGESIFLSHMGEMNPDLTAEQAVLIDKPFPWTDAADPVCAVGRLRGGSAVLVNLAPGPDHAYTLLVCPVTMLDVDGEDKLAETIHGWFRPRPPIADFLADYSRHGGTHHSALVYGDVAKDITRFGTLMGWQVVTF
ncbi:MAG: L-arabinose isomerase family protein [Armatimonadota bacterium]